MSEQRDKSSKEKDDKNDNNSNTKSDNNNSGFIVKCKLIFNLYCHVFHLLIIWLYRWSF